MGTLEKFWVEIFELETGKTESLMGPMSESKAERVERGASTNLNHAKYCVRILKLDLPFNEVLEANLEKLASRKARGVLQGSGSDR